MREMRGKVTLEQLRRPVIKAALRRARDEAKRLDLQARMKWEAVRRLQAALDKIDANSPPADDMSEEV